jgi:hypothetical protein
MVRSRDRARAAALAAEVVALRATVTELRAELARVREETAAAIARAVPVEITEADPRWVTLQMPLVKLALGDPADVTSGPEVAAALASPDRGADTVQTEIVLEPTPAPADKMVWSVLANLPERPLLDPRADRDQEPRDVARPEADSGRETAPHRRTA